MEGASTNTANSNNNPAGVDNAAIVNALGNNEPITFVTPADPVETIDDSGNLVNDKGEIIKTKDQIEAEKGKPEPKFDTEGNLIDETGKVIKSKADIDAEKAVAEVKLDKDGNQIDDTGKIIKTKEELEKEAILNDDSLTVPVIISKLSGFEPVDEEGEPIVYGDSYEELARRDVDIVNQFGTEIARNRELAFYEAFPVAHEVNSLIIKHNISSVDDLVKLLDVYKGDAVSLDVEKATEPQLLDVIIQARMAKGDSREEAERFAAYSKADNKLKDDAKTSYDFINKQREGRIAAQETARKDAEAARQKEVDDYWTDVADTINKGKLFDYTLPENIKVGNKLYTRQDFFDYLMKPVKGNYSQDMIDEAGEPIDSKLLRSYLRFTKGDMSQLVKIEVQKQTVKSIKDKLSKHNQVANSPDGNTGKTVSNAQLLSSF